MRTKVTNLTKASTRAMTETGVAEWGVTVAETYAVFPGSASEAFGAFAAHMAAVGKEHGKIGHPYASLHSVGRKLAFLADAEKTPVRGQLDPKPDLGEHDNGDFRPSPGEQFQIRNGLLRDGELFRVIEYAPMTAAPEKIQDLYKWPIPFKGEAVHAWKIEEVKQPNGVIEEIGTGWCAFPVEVIVPVGSQAMAPEVAQSPKRVRSRSGSPTSGACEHCGAPTKGGKFVPGHDAKLKGELARAAAAGDVEAMAESALRANINSKWAVEVPSKSQAKVDALVDRGDEFMAERIAARSGLHEATE